MTQRVLPMGIGAEVLDFVALVFQMGDHLVLQVQCAMITADGNFHNIFLLT